MFNWNDLNSFLTLSRSSRLLKASKKLKIEPTTIARRIKRLEKSLNCNLFHKSPKGYFLTEKGYELVKYAENIESEVFRINENLEIKSSLIRGKVRISVGEGLGVEIISKYIHKFYEQNPEIEIELLADTKLRSLSNRETDILISLSRPQSGRLKYWKLCDYFVKLYASKSFLKKNQISSFQDLNNKPFISYVDEFVDFPELDYLREVCSNANVLFTSNSLRSQLIAVKSGLGLGLLHTFIGRKHNDLVLVLGDKINIKREYWVVSHENNYQLERFRAVFVFLKELFKNNIVNDN